MKKLRDTFLGWSQEQARLQLVNGVSLWDTLKEDMKSDGPEAITMGTHYYETLR